MPRSVMFFPRALLASASLLLLTVPGKLLWAGAFDGRWVEIPYCDPPSGIFGDDCGTNPGWPAVEAIHVSLTKDKKLLYWRNTMWRKNIAVECWRKAHYWDPATTMDQALPATDSPWPAGKKDAFCAGHSQLGDGRILVAGGEDAQAVADSTVKPTGINTVWIFDPASPSSLQELTLASMAYIRWYGTPNVLPDGRVSVTSGIREPDPDPYRRYRVAEKPEIYDPYSGASGTWTTTNIADTFDRSAYAWLRLIPGASGTKLLYLGPGHTNYLNWRALKNLEVLGDLETSSPTWAEVASPAEQLRGGSQVWFDAGKILKTGGVPAGDPQQPANAVASAEVITINTSTGQVQSIAPTSSMWAARHEHNLTVLPDGKVLATGGMSVLAGEGEHASLCQNAVFTTEMWNPAGGQWSLLEPMTHPRMYHSVALLMPDGRIFSAGGECYPDCPAGISTYCVNADYYEPPYLFKNIDVPINDSDRPASSNPLKSLAHGEPEVSFPVTNGDGANGIDKVSLIRPGSVSHAFDMDQRYVSLVFVTSVGDSITVTGVPDAKVLHPGHYMLFLVNDAGHPSYADLVLVWSIKDKSVSHTMIGNPGMTFTLTVTWKTTGKASDGDELRLTPPGGGTIVVTGIPSDPKGISHSLQYTGTCIPGQNWTYTVKSKATRLTAGDGKSVSSSSTKTFRITNCLD